MTWLEVQQKYPTQWLVVEAKHIRIDGTRCHYENIDVLAICESQQTTIQVYGRYKQENPERELAFVHTSLAELVFEIKRIGSWPKRVHVTTSRR